MITCHCPDVSSVFNWSCHVGNLLQPIRSTTQIWEVTRHQYGVFALVPQTWFRGKTNSGVAECRRFSWAAFKSNHRHSELTNRNVVLRAARCNSRIWICRRKRYQRKEWEPTLEEAGPGLWGGILRCIYWGLVTIFTLVVLRRHTCDNESCTKHIDDWLKHSFHFS